MRIQNTDDYREYLSRLGMCTAGCEGKHSGLVDDGCGFPPGTLDRKAWLLEEIKAGLRIPGRAAV
jgi:hypothetical protein